MATVWEKARAVPPDTSFDFATNFSFASIFAFDVASAFAATLIFPAPFAFALAHALALRRTFACEIRRGIGSCFDAAIRLHRCCQLSRAHA
jgi:hypothetical protein